MTDLNTLGKRQSPPADRAAVLGGDLAQVANQFRLKIPAGIDPGQMHALFIGAGDTVYHPHHLLVGNQPDRDIHWSHVANRQFRLFPHLVIGHGLNFGGMEKIFQLHLLHLPVTSNKGCHRLPVNQEDHGLYDVPWRDAKKIRHPFHLFHARCFNPGQRLFFL